MTMLGSIRYKFVVAGETAEWSILDAVLDEALHELPRWTFDVLTPSALSTSLIGKPLRFELSRSETSEQTEPTLIRDGVIVGIDQMHRVSEAGFRARLRVSSKGWLLSLGRRRKIFKEFTSSEVITQICSEAGLSATVTATTRTHSMLTQFDESNYDFVRRLCEDEGLTLLFEHDDSKKVRFVDGTSGSVFADLGSFHYGGEDESVLGDRQVSSFTRELRAAPSLNKTVEWDISAARAYSTTLATASHLAKAITLGSAEVETHHAGERYLPGSAEHAATGRLLGAAQAQVFDLHRGVSNIEEIRPGGVVTITDLDGHEDGDKFLITRALHHLTVGEGEAGEPVYQNEFECVASTLPHRPARVLPRPKAIAPQVAKVVGFPDNNKGNGWGEVRVEFGWDADAAQTAWVRVAQTLAGNGFGSFFLPRVGMEVVVHFIDGDPDRPLITGVVYNGVNAPPVALPGAHSKSTIRTRSYGNKQPDNEIFFEDEGDKEVLGLIATRDHTVTVTHDAAVTVGNNRTETVEKDDSHTVRGNLTLGVDKNRTTTVKGNDKTTVEGDARTIIYGKLTISADAGVVIQCGDTKLELTPTEATLTNSAGVKLALGPASAKLENPTAGSVEAAGPGVTLKNTGGAQVALVGPMVNLN